MNAGKIVWPLVVMGLVAFAVIGCDDADPIVTKDPIVIEDPPPTVDPIVIVDLTGMEWDITYAVNELGMSPDRFNYGMGPNAIRPVTDPRFISPGDDDYPRDDERFHVLGATVAGEHRAYPIDQLTRHEVVDDMVGDIAFAAAY